MKLYSWNVNGIRAVINKGAFQKFMVEHRPDILCLQETKIGSAELSAWRESNGGGQVGTFSRQDVANATSRSEKSHLNPQLLSQPESLGAADLLAQPGQAEIDLPEYKEYWNSATKKGYSGTAIFSKTPAIQVINGFPANIIKIYNISDDTYGNPNDEGRVIAAEFESFWVVTTYTPNSKGDLSRLELRYKHWDPAFLAYVQELQKTKPVLFCGDLNVAHKEIDLANPKSNLGKHGFTDQERQGFQNFIDAGFIDIYRNLHMDKTDAYTWWTHWANARTRNIGWRIDYWLASKLLKDNVIKAEIHPDVLGSDHCPVSIELEI